MTTLLRTPSMAAIGRSLPSLQQGSQFASASASSSSLRLLHTTAPAWGKSPPGKGKHAVKLQRRLARLGLTDASQLKDLGKKKSKKDSETMTLSEAVKLFSALECARPANAYEVHIVTTVESHQTNALRGRLSLPNESRTKAEKLLILAEDDSEVANLVQRMLDENPALKGQIIIGGGELIKEIVAGTGAGAGIQFTKVLCTHGILPQLSRQMARSLGPRGLMPSVKRGTVVGSGPEMQLAIREAQGGIDWRGDRQGVIRAAVGRINFTEEQLRANMASFLHGIIEKISLGLTSGATQGTLAQPSPEVGLYSPAEQKRAVSIIKQIHLSSTQGPAVLIPLSEVL